MAGTRTRGSRRAPAALALTPDARPEAPRRPAEPDPRRAPRPRAWRRCGTRSRRLRRAPHLRRTAAASDDLVDLGVERCQRSIREPLRVALLAEQVHRLIQVVLGRLDLLLLLRHRAIELGEVRVELGFAALQLVVELQKPAVRDDAGSSRH